MVLDGKSLQAYPVNVGVLKVLFYTTLYFSIFYSELESDLRDTVNWRKKWLVDFNAGKTQLVLFDRSNNNGLLF